MYIKALDSVDRHIFGLEGIFMVCFLEGMDL